MFGQNTGGGRNSFGDCVDFMVFNEVMNGGQKKQKNQESPKRDRDDKSEKSSTGK